VTDSLEHQVYQRAVEMSLALGPDGSTRPVTLLVSSSPITTSMGTLAVVALEDISERKQMEDRVHRLNRLLGTIREINQLIVRESSREWMLAETCRIIVEHGGFRMAWIGVADQASGEVRPLAVAGHEDGFLAEAQIRCDDSPRGRGPEGVAVREGRTVVIHDIGMDPSTEPWRDPARSRAYGSVISLPLEMASGAVGTLSVVADQPAVFDDEIIGLVEELAADVGFALRTIEISSRRTQAERALRESEERYRQLFEAESDAILLIDNLTGRILEANSATEALYGYSRDELLALHNTDLSAEAQETRARTTARVDPGQVIHIPLRLHRHRNGTVIEVEITGRFFEWQGRPVHIAAIRDITERRRADAALQGELVVRTALTEISKVVMAEEIRMDDVEAAVLQHARQLTTSEYGFMSEIDPTTGDSVCRSFVGHLAPLSEGDDEWPRLTFRRDPDGNYPGLTGHALNTREAFLTNTPDSHPATRGVPDGHVPVERFMAVPVMSGGKLLGMVALANPERDYEPADLDAVGRLADYYAVAIDRARWENELVVSEIRYRTLFEHSPLGIYRSRPDGRIVDANPTMIRMLGYDSLEALQEIDLKLALYYAEGERSRIGHELEESGLVAGFETTLRHRSGRPVYVRESARAIRDETGSIVYFEGTFEDVTERHLLAEQLLQAQKMEAVGRLAGGVAHDFNNLLQAMLSQTQIIRSASTDPERITVIADDLEQEIHRGASFTRQLLLFSRREPTQIERLDVNRVIEQQAGLLRRMVRENIAFRLNLAPGSLWVDGDQGQLGQVLMNLVVNASDALENGGELTLRSGGNDDSVWFTVEDNGPGVSEEIRVTIFEPFFTTKAATKGTGLGLSVVHGIVSQHRGAVRVEDREGGGSVFSVTLPRVQSEPEVQPADTTDTDRKAPARGHGERILVVEDEPAAREALAELLDLLGYEVAAVGSAEEALALEEAAPFHILLTDLMLPGASGTSLAVTLRARWPDLEVLLMSGYAEDEIVRRDIGAGAVRFLQKPFDLATLARELRLALAEDDTQPGSHR
jgi:PAS domain S-box-containing protein